MRKLSIKKALIIVAVFFLFLSFYWVFIKSKSDEKGAKTDTVADSYSIPRQIQYSFSLKNKTNLLLKNAEFWTYAPVKKTATQRCDHIEASHPYLLISDDLGNQVLHFTFDVIPPYGTRIITIKADLMLSDRPNSVVLTDPKPYLQSEKYIESDNPAILKTAQKLSKPTTLETAENIFKWVANNVKYSGYISHEQGALYTLSHKKGDCTEYMYLFTALCRANRIPARCTGGYICRANSILKPGGYHNWSQFYQNGSWRVVDPQNKIFMKDPFHYIAMRVFGASLDKPAGIFHRFRFKGEGLNVRMNS